MEKMWRGKMWNDGEIAEILSKLEDNITIEYLIEWAEKRLRVTTTPSTIVSTTTKNGKSTAKNDENNGKKDDSKKKGPEENNNLQRNNSSVNNDSIQKPAPQVDHQNYFRFLIEIMFNKNLYNSFLGSEK